MGLMKKAVRRATPRPVRKAKAVVRHPVGTATRAATPRSVRNAKRTVFNATHPINTAENKIVRAAVPRKPPRSRASGNSGNLSGSAWAAIITFAIVATIGRGSQASAIIGVILALIVYVIGKWPASTPSPAPAATVTVETSSVARVGPIFPQRITQSWIDREVPNLSEEAMAVLVRTLHERGWRDDEIAERVQTRR